MPIVRVDMLAGRTHQQKQEIAEVFSHELARIARCAVDDVQVIFTEVDRNCWATGGRLTGAGHAAAPKAKAAE
jgi:4-oxalocrotonate tautomerase